MLQIELHWENNTLYLAIKKLTTEKKILGHFFFLTIGYLQNEQAEIASFWWKIKTGNADTGSHANDTK